jgi:hypothetical protein
MVKVHDICAKNLAGADGAQHGALVLVEVLERFLGFGVVGARLDAAELPQDCLLGAGRDVVKSVPAEVQRLGDHLLRQLAPHVDVGEALDD